MFSATDTKMTRENPIVTLAKKHLSNDKESISIQFDNHFRPYYSEFTGKTCQYVLTNEENTSILFEEAKKIISLYPKGKVVSLGQSPAWIIAAASLMEDTNPERFDGVAFSGSFYTTQKRTRRERSFCGPAFIRRQAGPNADQINAYRNYLSHIGLDPETLSHDFSSSNPLVIVEFACTGTGLVSFLSILLDWAKELDLVGKLYEAIKIHLLVMPESVFLNSKVNILGFNYVAEPIDANFMHALSTSDDFDDRLIPSYPFDKFTNDYFPQFGDAISYNAKLVIAKMTYLLESHHSLSQHVCGKVDELSYLGRRHHDNPSSFFRNHLTTSLQVKAEGNIAGTSLSIGLV